MKLIRRGCLGCLIVPLVVVVAVPFMALSWSGDPGASAATAQVTGTISQAREVTWSPLFQWTPPTGEPEASSWPWGQCTWFVVSEGHLAGDHHVRWSGDAWQWYADAAAAGFATQPPSARPTIGWIAVYARGHGSNGDAGHVAVVVATSATTYTVAESNVLGLGVVDERTLPLPGSPSDTSSPLLEGWID